ncbi:peptidase inhibitor family I36 protein [Streptomyces rimosus]|uniref:peptidase inhibitor family I36 protein n=1 Tax=Streptomyces rimosus TaxID=1927 RepID=UPI00131AEFB7|nr:peptidase inhibitor family I36 protein [Streptomyces rimosus]
MRFKSSIVAAAAFTAFAAVVATGGSAHAMANLQNCSKAAAGPLCLYYNSNNKGAHVGVQGDVYNYGIAMTPLADPGIKFNNNGAGGGKYVKNAVASVYNYDTYMGYYVYVNSGYAGPFDAWPPYGYAGSRQWFGNLNNTYNNNASQARH